MRTQRPINRPEPADMEPWKVIEKLHQSNAELLEAGEAIIQAWESGDLAAAVRKLAAAIAKAKGQ